MSTTTDVKHWKSLMAAGKMAYMTGDFLQSARQYSRALRVAEEQGMDGALLAEPLIHLSVCLSARRDYTEAERLLQRALAAAQFEGDPVLLAYTYHELSVLMWRTGRDAESRQMNDLALDNLDSSEDEIPDLRVNTLKQRAVLLANARQYDEAQKLLDTAMEIALSSPDHGKHSLLYGQVMITKALLCIDLHKFDEARDLYLQAIQIVEMCWGPHHPKVADLYDIFAGRARDVGKENVAEFFHKKSHDLREWIKHSYKW